MSPSGCLAEEPARMREVLVGWQLVALAAEDAPLRSLADMVTSVRLDLEPHHGSFMLQPMIELRRDGAACGSMPVLVWERDEAPPTFQRPGVREAVKLAEAYVGYFDAAMVPHHPDRFRQSHQAYLSLRQAVQAYRLAVAGVQ